MDQDTFLEESSKENLTPIDIKRNELFELIDEKIELNVNLLIKASQEFLSNISEKPLYDSETISIAHQFIQDVYNANKKWAESADELAERYKEIEGKDL